MNLTVEFSKPEMKGAFDWQLSQEINVIDTNNEVIAKAEIELITMNKHRGADETFALLDQAEATDWEIPLHIYFKKQNIAHDLAEKIQVIPDNKAKTHILLEAISVKAANRKQGIAKYLLQEVAKHHTKAQSISVLSMPMKLFVDADDCISEENRYYYKSLNLEEETMGNDILVPFFNHCGFVDVGIDDSALEEPLPYKILVASPQMLG
jgi:GNAT superfamily N-acetyltransferase